MIPLVDVHGSAYERGLQYGHGAHDRIQDTLSMYRRVFEEMAGLSWPDVVAKARRYVTSIAEFEPSYLEEIRGIAAGAGVDFVDILAINSRTEIMFSSVVKQQSLATDGCSSVAVAAPASRNGHVLIGQNWDWLPAARDNLVVLRAQQDDLPSYVTVVEAGLLAKMGLNSAGVGSVTNALISGGDSGSEGVPFHFLLRAILDCGDAQTAESRVSSSLRSSSANFLIADSDSNIFDLESASGSTESAFQILPTNGWICHTNHFTVEDHPTEDVMVTFAPDTLDRFARFHGLMEGQSRFDLADLEAALRDHVNRPGSICRHPDTGRPWYEQSETLASVVCDLETKDLWLTEGPPCQGEYSRVAVSAE